MANKVINTILRLKDEMSGGLVKAAKNTQGVTREMQTATKQVIAWKNKSISAVKDFAKTTAGVGMGAVTALTTAFFALDGATEEFRLAQAKVKTSFDNTNASAQTASDVYRELYGVIGDAGTTAEAAQHLSSLTSSQKELTQWITAATGVFGKFGDAVPVNTIYEAASETARTGVLTGTLVDAIIRCSAEGERFGVTLRENTEANEEWNEAVKSAETAEDFFNLALKQCNSQAERQQLILDTLTKGYGQAATAFRENNKEVIASRQAQVALNTVLAKVGESSGKVKNALAAVMGVEPNGAIRAGSAFDMLNQNAEKLATTISKFTASGGTEKLGTMIDTGITKASQFAGSAINYLKNNSDSLKTKLKVLAVTIATIKILKIGSDAISATKTLLTFGKTVLTIAKANIPMLTAAYWKNTAAAGANKALLTGIWLKNQAVYIATSSAAWVHNTAMIGVNKAGLLAHKAVGGAVWLGTQSKAIAISSAAWVKNTAALAANKTALIASKVATGAATVGTGALTAAQGLLNTAFYASPIGWIVLAVMGLVAAGVALYKNWDVVKAKALELWDKAKSVFGGIKDSIVGAFDYAKSKVSGFFSWIDKKLESVPILGDMYKNTKTVGSWILGKIGGNAMGTSYWRGGLTAVHERGGEIIDLPSGTRIIPHDVSLSMARDFNAKIANRTISPVSLQKTPTSATNIIVNITVQGNMISNKEYAKELGEEVAGEIIKKMENIA